MFDDIDIVIKSPCDKGRASSSSSLSGGSVPSSEASSPSSRREGEYTITPNLIAPIEPVGDGSAYGTVTLSYNMDGSFLVSLDMGGLTTSTTTTSSSTSGTVIIAESCDGEEKVGDWDGVTNVYNVLSNGTLSSNGISKSAFRHNNGHSAEENVGKTVVIYYDDNTGTNASTTRSTVIGCGTLGMENEEKEILVATMGLYPGYTGELEAEGTVTVTFHPNNVDSFMLEYTLSGLGANCTDHCGITINVGTSCETHEQVQEGHYWNSDMMVQDLWTTDGGAVYSYDTDDESESGAATGYFQMNNGYGYEENLHHAVVVHAQDGTRVSCGILM